MVRATDTQFLVKDAKPGDIIETITFGSPSGNVYKIAAPCDIMGKVPCYQRFTRTKVRVHPNVACRKLDPKFVDGF